MTESIDKTKKILIINKENLMPTCDNSKLLIKKFLHPKTNEPRSFLCDSNSNLYELIKYEPECSSLFIDNYVQSNLNMYFVEKFNVNYFLISNLYKNQNEFLTFNELCLNDELTNKSFNMKNYINIDDLEKVFDVKKEKNDEIMLKFNLTKCLNWLKNKVIKLNDYLKMINKDIKNIKVSNDGKNDVLINAFELIAQYINSSLSQLLMKELDINESIENINPNDCKRVKSSVN